MPKQIRNWGYPTMSAAFMVATDIGCTTIIKIGGRFYPCGPEDLAVLPVSVVGCKIVGESNERNEWRMDLSELSADEKGRYDKFISKPTPKPKKKGK